MSAPQKYRKKPVVIEAVQWTGDNRPELADFMGADPVVRWNHSEGDYVVLTTIHGETARARVGDWIVPEPQDGRYYPVRPDIFAATYEAVSE